MLFYIYILKSTITSLGTVTNCLNPTEEYFYLSEEKTAHRLKLTDDSEKSINLETVPFDNTIVASATTQIGEIIVPGSTNVLGPICTKKIEFCLWIR